MDKIFIKYEPLIGTDIEEAAIVLTAKLLQLPHRDINEIEGVYMDFNGICISRTRKDIRGPRLEIVIGIIEEYKKK